MLYVLATSSRSVAFDTCSSQCAQEELCCAQLGNLLPLPSASSDAASDSACVRGGKEQMGGGSFLLFYSWSLVLF